MTSLQHPYIGVQRGDHCSYGGSQMESRFPAVRRSGCGLIAAADLLRYLHCYRPGCRTDFWPDETVEQETYERLTLQLRRRFLPVFPPTGMTGIGLALGVSLFFRRYRIPLKARWCVSGKKLWQRIRMQLESDLPVILSVGPNLPCFWRKQNLTFYQKAGNGPYYPANAIRAHYVIVTGIDERWLRISSWGKEYYVNRTEYDTYVQKNSNYIVSNMLLIAER